MDNLEFFKSPITIRSVTLGAGVFTLMAGILAYLDFILPAMTVAVLTLITIFTSAILFKKPGTVFIAYLLGLPAYTLTLAILFLYTGSVSIINILQMWKEFLALAALAIVGIHILIRFRFKTLHLLDWLVIIYALLNLLYLVTPIGPDLTTRLYGFRANAFFTVIYFLGRLIPLSKGQQKVIIGVLIAIGVFAGLFVIFEVFALPKNWPARVGLMGYLREFYGVSPIGHYGLTWTFETSTGIRRYSAFFSNPLELASSTLITAPAAFYLSYKFRSWTLKRLISRLSFGLITLSLLLAISRASLVAFVIEMVVISIWLKKRYVGFFFVLGAILGLIALFLFADQGMIDFIWETITFQNPSSQGHLEGWLQGARAIFENPLGLGLGNSGHIGSRFGTQIGGENQYVIIGVDLGITGLLLYIFIQLLSIYYPLKVFHRASGTTKALAFTTASAKLGLLIPAFTSNIEVYIFAMFTTWWLVGFSVQQMKKRNLSNQPENINQYKPSRNGSPSPSPTRLGS